MQHKLIQSVGIAWTLLFAAFIIWIYATEPRSLNETDRERFSRALDMFHRGEFRAAREEWERADPTRADARTQFYIAYSFYREGQGFFVNDKDLFRQGIEAADRAIKLPTGPTFTLDDSNLLRYAAAGLKAEIQQALDRPDFYFDPFRTRQ